MASARELANAMIELYKKNNWNYDFDEEKNLLTSKTSIEKGKLKNCMYYVQFLENRIQTYAVLDDFKVDEENRLKAAEYICRTNYSRLAVGCLQIDMNDGEIRYQYTLDCAGIPDEELLSNSQVFPASVYGWAGDGLLAVIYGFMTPEEAVEMGKEN